MVLRAQRRRRIELIVLALRDNDIGPSLLKGFNGKLIVQKVAYLLQEAFGVDLGVKFVWHSYGPYSYEIAKDYKLINTFMCVQSNDNMSIAEGNGVKGIREFKEFLKSLKKKFAVNEDEIGYWLEIIASLYMLSKKIYPPPEDVVDELLERKPYVSRKDAIRALRFLREEGLL